MHNMDVMALFSQRFGELLHVDGIAAEVIRRVERRYHAEFQSMASGIRS